MLTCLGCQLANNKIHTFQITANKIIEIQDGFAMLVVGEDLNISKMTKSNKGTKEKPGKDVAIKADLTRRWLTTAPYRFGFNNRFKHYDVPFKKNKVLVCFILDTLSVYKYLILL